MLASFNKPPCSSSISDAEANLICSEMLKMLRLNPEVEIARADGALGLKLEQQFRFAWWSSYEDPWRLALHEHGYRMFTKVSQSPEYERRMTQGWLAGKEIASSTIWRSHFREMVQADPKSRTYYRMFFRLAAQALLRHTRWLHVMGVSTYSPYAALLELLAGGRLPLGYHTGRLHLFSIDASEYVVRSSFPQTPPSRGPNAAISVFYSFQNATLVEQLRETLQAIGFNVLAGPIPESPVPLERQIAQRIHQSLCCIALVDAEDPDFGLPIWIHQEIEYAKHANKPILAFCQGTSTDHSLQDVTIKRPQREEDVLLSVAEFIHSLK